MFFFRNFPAIPLVTSWHRPPYMKTNDLNKNLDLLLTWDFNEFFNGNLECCGGNLSFKQKSVAKLIKIIETFWRIWIIRNP